MFPDLYSFVKWQAMEVRRCILQDLEAVGKIVGIREVEILMIEKVFDHASVELVIAHLFVC
jgi:hypothetical protein